MRKTLYAAGWFAACWVTGMCFANAEQKESLCVLQAKVTEGAHVRVQVGGVFSIGLENGTLEDPVCPAQATWVELGLQSERNKEKLRRLLERSGRAYVVLEGEFYGPGVADPKLPEAIRKSYHPGWGHLAAFRTKMVVRTIRSVRAVPAGKPGGDGK